MTTVKMPTKELRGEALGWAAAKAVGQNVIIVPHLETVFDCNALPYTEEINEVKYSPDGVRLDRYLPWAIWDQGGPLIEQYEIEIISHGEGQWASVEEWCYGEVMSCYTTSPTYLTAGMRAIVELKLGKTVDIPEELAQ